MNAIQSIPELKALHSAPSVIRIPDQINVPVTARIRKLIDTPQFQRLKQVSQLGFVAEVYPGATHNRFEHSLGVYRLSLLFLQQLSSNESFCRIVTERDATRLIVAALLHDIAHWPFCHPIEDIRIDLVPQHEDLAIEYLNSDEISSILKSDFELTPDDIHNLLIKNCSNDSERILASILSGPIDVDKMDYLFRDSLHSGVPYGRNFDSPRLIGSLCLNRSNQKIAIADKGKTAAELMVFARYVMFSEVYWHHAVRSATAMFQRAFYLIHHCLEPEHFRSLIRCQDTEIAGIMKVVDTEKLASPILDSLFTDNRNLYKRWLQFSFSENNELHQRIARLPYADLVHLSKRIENELSASGVSVNPNDVLVDAPPVGLEVQFNVDVFSKDSQVYQPLGNVSPVVRTLASHQFDDFVKKVRVFVHPRIHQAVKDLDGLGILNVCLNL